MALCWEQFAVMSIGIYETATLIYVLLFTWWKGIVILDKFCRSGVDV
jgi:hypothetical protein